MKVWKLKAVDEDYDNLRPINGYTADELQAYDGRSHQEGWIPKKVERLEPEKNLKLGDALQCMTIPTFSLRAVEKLFELIKNEVEILPLLCDEGNFSMINVTTVLDAIDYEKAKFKRFKSSNRIMCFDKFAFKEDVIASYNIFKIVDMPRSYVFVTDNFVSAVKKNRLKGFSFDLVWDSEAE